MLNPFRINSPSSPLQAPGEHLESLQESSKGWIGYFGYLLGRQQSCIAATPRLIRD
jgi:hypothetical protein